MFTTKLGLFNKAVVKLYAVVKFSKLPDLMLIRKLILDCIQFILVASTRKHA